MSDYTLPPFPRGSVAFWALNGREAAKQWGEQCAEAARAPLLARIAELDRRLLRRATVVEEQKARIAELEAAYRGLDAYKRALSSRVGALEAQLAQAPADAKRYRWLRECDDGADRELHTSCRSELLSGAALDDAVDRLMKEYGDA